MSFRYLKILVYIDSSPFQCFCFLYIYLGNKITLYSMTKINLYTIEYSFQEKLNILFPQRLA